jgi:hypothetical protein
MIRLRTIVLRLLRVPCGSYGGQLFDGTTRWCLKTFGHSDSCAWDPTGVQPLHRERRRAKGWDE